MQGQGVFQLHWVKEIRIFSLDVICHVLGMRYFPLIPLAASPQCHLSSDI